MEAENQNLLQQSPQQQMENVKEVKIGVEWLAKDMFFMPAEYEAAHADEEKAGCELTVFVQGKNLGENFDLKERELVFMTVHDIGTNPMDSFIPFANSSPMARLRDEAVFLHVCVPGHESGANDFSGSFPSMEQLAELLPQVLDFFHVKQCIAMGEGAGADAICRFALMYPQMLGGIVLIHCTSAAHGLVENLREMLTNMQIDDGKMNAVGWDYLLMHKFGEHHKERKKHFIEHTHRIGLNEHNLSRYLYSFSYRPDFSDMLKQNLLQVHAILVTGSKSPHNKNVFHLYQHMDKGITTLMVAEDAVDVLSEAPEYIAQALFLLKARLHRNSPKPLTQKESKEASTKSLNSFPME